MYEWDSEEQQRLRERWLLAGRLLALALGSVGAALAGRVLPADWLDRAEGAEGAEGVVAEPEQTSSWEEL